MIAPALKLLTNGRVDPTLLGRISEEIALVEEELALQVRSQVSLVQRVSTHTIDAGGKRLRPAFVSLTAQATGRPFEAIRARRLGVAMEMIHMATLIHDDVIDDSSTRRGRPTAARAFGNTAAILGGDALLAKAMLLLAKDGDVELIQVVSEAVVDLAEGEVKELEVRGDFNLDREAHLEVLRLKTASLIECCCQLGGIVTRADSSMRAALRRYGFHIGMAFQIVDDLLDYRGDLAKTGKPRATDFREGQSTLPLIYLLPELSEAETALLRRKFGNHPSDDEIRMLADWMESRGAFHRAEQDALDHCEMAKATLAAFPDSGARQVLESVAEYVVRREL